MYKKNKEVSSAEISMQLAGKTAKSFRRESPIEDYLYSDALRRRGRDTLLSRRDYRN